MASRVHVLVAALVLGGAVVAGCGDGDGAPPPATAASLTVTNSTDKVISELYLSPASSGSWGANQLSSPIPAGGSRVIENLTPGAYDLRAVATDGTAYEWRGAAVAAGQSVNWSLGGAAGTPQAPSPEPPSNPPPADPAPETPPPESPPPQSPPPQTPPPAAPGSPPEAPGPPPESPPPAPPTPPPPPPAVDPATLRVVNGSPLPLVELYVSPASSGDWGPNQLTAAIPPGGTFGLHSIPAGTYDLKVVASSRGSIELYGVVMQAADLYEWIVQLPTGSLDLLNLYSSPLVALFVSPVQAASWGPNQLGRAIAYGERAIVSSIPIGLYDLRVLAADGLEGTKSGVPIYADRTTYETFAANAAWMPGDPLRLRSSLRGMPAEIVASLDTEGAVRPLPADEYDASEAGEPKSEPVAGGRSGELRLVPLGAYAPPDAHAAEPRPKSHGAD